MDVLTIIIIVGAVLFFGVGMIASLSKSLSNSGLFQILRAVRQRAGEGDEPEGPRSLSNCESLYLPKIHKDFPAFNLGDAMKNAKEALSKHLEDKEAVKIHGITLRNYISHKYEQTVVFQAAAEYKEDGKPVQKRYLIPYIHRIGNDERPTTASCPHCGGQIERLGEERCSYCGSILVNPLKGLWRFGDITED